MEASLTEMSFRLMLYGMGVVFLFLGVAVLAVSLMSRIIDRYFHSTVPDEPTATTAATSAVDPHIVRAIQLALDKHRGRRS